MMKDTPHRMRRPEKDDRRESELATDDRDTGVTMGPVAGQADGETQTRPQTHDRCEKSHGTDQKGLRRQTTMLDQ